MNPRFAKRRAARERWSRNAVRKRNRLRIERAQSEPRLEPSEKVYTPKMPRFDLRVMLERPDGKVQFTLHHYYGKLIGETINMSPKQFGRRLGEMFALWMQE